MRGSACGRWVVVFVGLLLGGSLALSGSDSPGTEGPGSGPRSSASVLWVRQFGTPGGDVAYAVAVGPGGLYVAGEVGGALGGQPYAGGQDAFLRKYDTDGNVKWTRQFGAVGGDKAYGVAADSSGIYVAGCTGGDAFVRKYDPAGNLSSGGSFGDPSADDCIRGIAAEGTGLYAVGETDGVLPGQTSRGKRDAFLRRMDSSGVAIWTRQFGTSEIDEAYTVAADLTTAYVGGATAGYLSNGSGPLHSMDEFTQRYDTAGNLLWTVQHGWYRNGASMNSYVNGLSLASGKLYGAGSDEVRPGWNAFARAYLPNGTARWEDRFNASNVDVAWGIQADASGASVAGQTGGTYPGETSAGSVDAFVRRYDGAGVVQWTRQIGTAGYDIAWATTGDGSFLYVAGETDGTFPGQTSSGGRDAFVAKLRAPNRPPVAAGGGPYVGREGSTVTFNANGSIDPDGDPLRFRWDFTADGAWDTGWDSNPTASFTFPDDFVGKARVEVTEGTFNVTAEASVTIQNVAPSVDAGPGKATSERSSLAFSFTFQDPGFDAPVMGTWENFTATVDWGYGPPEGAPVVKFPGRAGVPTTGLVNVSHTYGDDGAFPIAVTVCDDDDGGCGSASLTVTVDNVAPTIGDVQVYVVANVSLRVAGEKWHDVRLDLLWNGDATATERIVRFPGSPNAQEGTITSAHLELLGSFAIVVYYTPADDPVNGHPNGANPVWVILAMPDGSEVWLHHTFNVQHPDTWTWSLDDFRPYLVGQEITFRATASDIGSDDLTFAWSFGDGATAVATYYNNGVSPDPFPSPEVNPITATDVAAHAFAVAGTYTITLTVTDDDGGIVRTTFTLAIGP